MKEATHARKGKTISDLATGQTKPFKSINAAKRESLNMRRKAGVNVRRLPRSDSERMKTFSNGRQ